MKNVIILLLICFGLWCFFIHKSPIIKNNDVTPEMKIITDAEVKRVEYIIDKKGFQHAVMEEVENTVGDINMIRDSARMAVDSALNLRDIERNKLKEFIQHNVSWRDSFMMAKRVNDSIFKYSGNNLKIEFVNRKDTPYFNYSYDAKINYLSYWHKKHLLAPRKHYTDFWIEDTKATINGVKRIKIQQPTKPVFELNLIGRYDIRPLGGGEVFYKNGRIGVGIGYLRDFEQQEWIPSITTKFNLLEF